MTHSLDEAIAPRSHMTHSFRESVLILIKQSGVRYTAELLKMLGIPFDDAYELIFNRIPADMDAPMGSPQWNEAMDRAARPFD